MQATDMPPEAVKDFRDLYNKHPDAIKKLCEFPGEVGALAQMCVECGVKLSNGYKVDDPDHLPEMPSCEGCGGE